MAKLTDTIILGDLIVTGKTHLKDDLTIDEQVTSDFIPDVDNSYDLGSAVKRFANIYATAIIVDGVVTSVTSTTSNTMTLGNSTNGTSTTLVADGNSFQLNVDGNLVFDVIDGNTEMDFHKDVRVRGSTPMLIFRPTGDAQQGRINYEDAAGNLHGSIQYEPSGDYLRYYSSTTSTEWWRFDSTGLTVTNNIEAAGNISTIGTGTQEFKVESTDAGLTQLHLRSNTRDWFIKNTSGVNDLIFDQDGTDLFWMDGTNTRFGVGIDPSATIHAKSATAEIRLQDTGVGDAAIVTYSFYDNTSSIGYIGYASSGNSELTLFNSEDDDIVFYTNSIERFRIDNGTNHIITGNLSVGDETYDTANLAGQGIVVSNNDGGATGRILIDVEDITSGYNTRIAQNNTGFIFESESNSRPIIFYTGSPLSEVVRIDTAGLDVIGNINVTTGDGYIGGNRILTVADEGAGNGLDADTLDGQQGSYYQAASGYTAADVLAKLITVDGSGSGLDADTLDGYHASAFVFGDSTNNSSVTIQVDDADFVIKDGTDSTTNFIWRDHSASILYLGTDDAVPTLRSEFDANNNDIYDVNRMQVGNNSSTVSTTSVFYLYESESQNANNTVYGLHSRLNASGDVSNFTTDRNRIAVYGYTVLSDNSTTSDVNVTTPIGVYGNSVITAGHADNMYGVYGIANTSGGADSNVANSYGGYFESRLDNVGSMAGTLNGVHAVCRLNNDVDDTVTANIVRALFNVDGGTIGTGRYFYGYTDQEAAGTITTLYGMHLDMQNNFDGTITTRRGLWIEGDTSYLSNSIGGRTFFGDCEGYITPDTPWLVHFKDDNETLIGNFQGSTSGAYATFSRSTSYAWDIGIDGSSDFIFRDNSDTTRLHLNYDMLPVEFDSIGMIVNSKRAFTYSDSWLSLNNEGAFTSGVYFNNSLVRTDGTGFSVGGTGTFLGRTNLDIASGDSTRHRIRVRGAGTSYTATDILLEDDSGSTIRGMGMYMYNRASGKEWYFGQPYNSDENSSGIYYSYQDNGSEGGETATWDNYVVEFSNTNQLLLRAGASGTPSLSFRDNQDTGFRLSSSEVIVGSDGNNVMGWASGNINVYNNATLNMDGTAIIAFDDRVASDPGIGTLISLGGKPILKQISDRGGLIFASADDTVVLGSGDVGNDFEAQISSETSEHTWIVSDGSVYLQSGLQSGYSTTNQVHFNNSGVMTIGGNTVWHAGNDGSGSGLDADLLDGYQSSSSSTSNTIALRDASSDIHARLFRSTYNTQTGAASTADIAFRNDTSDNYIRFVDGSGFVTWLTNHDGAGSGLDADLLDGNHASAFALSSHTHPASAITAGTFPSGLFRFSSSLTDITGGAVDSGLSVYANGASLDAVMSFHVGGDFAGYFGLSGALNDFVIGGWSYGGVEYRVWHAGNDGSGSGLDADTLDGIQESALGRLAAARTWTALQTFTGATAISGSGFTPTSNGNGAIRLSGAYGGGITFEDTAVSNIWVQSSGTEMHFCVGGAGSAEFKITSAGNVTATGDITAYSDERLKNVLNTFDRPELLDDLEVFDFSWKENEVKSFGPLAQRVQKHAPELVHANSDDGILSIDYGKYAVALVYEEKKRREQAETEINKLRDEVDELKDLVRQLLEGKNSE